MGLWIPVKSMGILQNFRKFRVRVWKFYRTSTSKSRELWHTGMQNPQQFLAGTQHGVPVPRVLLRGSYRTHRSSGYGYGSLTKSVKTSGYCGTSVQKFHKCRAGINIMYLYPGSLWHRRPKLPEVSGTGLSVLLKLQKYFVG